MQALNIRTRRAAVGLAALFAAAAAPTVASRADSPAYNPAPANAAQARQQIAYLRDQLVALPARFAGAADGLLNDPPAPLADKQPGERTCYTLSTSLSFSFDYGPGAIRTPMVRMIEVPASGESIRTAHARMPAMTPEALPPDTRYYATLTDFLNGNRDRLGDTAYTDVQIPPAYIGCAARPDDLRPAQQQANLAFFLAISGRVDARIMTDYNRDRAVLYRDTQDPVLVRPAPPTLSPHP